ncbi:AfsR/SARP family transcriptional regulator [Nonomuraea sediminis]|uniref:AfsR/SARP family transcriptional regulator n=1 Tax=Nonomuraea sediminis TaxID=2835864 RepID=UPI001BDC77F7|nr:BTAD domain-containing putative transcriptional regulator [Nonomuraea sediminis]
MTDDLRFSLLGPIRAWRGEQELELGSPQQRLVLAALVLAGGRTVGQDQLIDAVWGEAQPRTALSTLRTYVSRLRGVLGGSALLSVGDGYALAAGESDLALMERLCAEDRHAEALELWRGEPLAGVDSLYVQAQRARLAERRAALLERRLEADVEEGRHVEVVSELSALCSEHPTRERLRGLLMLALYRSGRQAEAIGVYTDTRRLLADELGVDPSPELAELYQRIISADPTLGAKLPAAAKVTHVPRQLPADVADFTGREREIGEMTAALRSGESSALVISAMAGVGGVGKTTLAVHVAHRLVPDFPDGQLFVDLRGSGPQPADPGTVLASFLRALGVEEAPEEQAERAALYRSVLAERRVLVVLDNAAGVGQLRPLLPGSACCAVLVTSRNRLIGLTGARQVDLEVMGPVEALRLFSRIVGEERVQAERGAAMDLVAACGFLPLAIRIAAARLAARPGWSIALMRDRLADERRRLAELRAGDLAIEATFALGYDQLDRDHARAFRLLSVPDAPLLSLTAAAALLDLSEAEAEEVCEALVDASMLESPSPGRYRYHDLLKIYARSRLDRPDEQVPALARLLDFYLAGTATAFRLVFVGDPRADRIATSAAGLSFAGEDEAVEWAHDEEQGILGCLAQAADTPGTPLRQAVDLFDLASDVLGVESDPSRYERLGDLLVDAAARREPGLEARTRVLRGQIRVGRSVLEGATEDGLAARDLSLAAADLVGYADALNLLALCAQSGRRHEEALEWFAQAIEVWRSLDAGADLATGLGNMSRSLVRLGRAEEAIATAQEADAVSFQVEGRRSPDAAYQLGIVLGEAGRPDEAIPTLDGALADYRRTKQRTWEGATLFRMAEAYLAAGRPQRSLDCAEDALAVLTEAADEWGQGMALTVLGRSLHELGQPGRASACLTEALEIFERYGLPEAEDVRDLLASVST